MGYSKNYRQKLIENVVDFGNTSEYEILHNDNTELVEHKEQSIPKQRQIIKINLLTILTMIKI